MKKVVTICGGTHCGKTMVLNFLSKNGLHKIGVTKPTIKKYMEEFKNLKIPKSKITDCFSSFDLNKKYDFSFYEKALDYTPYTKLVAVCWWLNERFINNNNNNITFIQITIVRDPRICWLLIDQEDTIEEFCFEQNQIIRRFGNNKIFKFEDFVTDYSVILSELFKPYSDIQIDFNKNKLPSKKFNKYLNMVDVKKAKHRLENYKNSYKKDFLYIENNLSNLIEFLDFEPVLNIDEILDPSK